VPLYGRSGELIGLIWADDPVDLLVPSPARLQALRVFANQATTALDAAAQFEEMEFLADHDPLTRLRNRRSFVRQLELETSRSDRYGRRFALLMGDVNGFKQVNDQRGHPAGDRALEALGRVLMEGRREVDGVYRIGGDEFALILPEVGGNEARAVAERIHDAMLGSGEELLIRLTISFGVAVYPEQGTDPESLFRAADESMYGAKRGPGGRLPSAR
jgi:two-component system, cell cycle response regulator